MDENRDATDNQWLVIYCFSLLITDNYNFLEISDGKKN